TDVIAPLNFAALEKQIDSTFGNTEPEPLFRAVAEAVAEAGPWGASMEMVAQRLGLSKSSLYGHFKNRKDMIRRLFIGEFKRILDFARQGIGLSPKPAEQLYLGIFSIAVYLRSRSEILTALDWLRTRKLDIGKSEKEMEEYFKLFVDIEIEPIMICEEIEKQHVSHWILFLIINTLIRFGKEGSVKNTDIRSLFRFITLGLRGFKQL
ncbi:MAG: TetR/AcrR family transcriptional regulator, partial [Treponema sp.]|nr:TetR/AcrR family transcriptional regulator [Treponema sp.]